MRQRAAFTLIELLVVLSIIALLIGILLPALSGAKRTTYKVICSSHLGQVGTALEMFSMDHQALYPIAGKHIDWGEIDTPPGGEWGGSGLPSWMEQTKEYIGNKEIYSGCTMYPNGTPYHYFLGSRAAYIDNGGDGNLAFGPLQKNNIAFTSAYVLSGDNTWSGFIDEGYLIDADKDNYTQRCLWFQKDGSHWSPHHEGGLNVLFVDNHVNIFRQIDLELMTFRYRTMSDW